LGLPYATALVAATGDIIGSIFLSETRDRDIRTYEAWFVRRGRPFPDCAISRFLQASASRS